MSTTYGPHRIGAAFAAAAMEAGTTGEAASALGAVARALRKDPALRSALAETALPADARIGAVRDVLAKDHPLVANLVSLLIEQDMLAELDAVREAALERFAALGAYHEVTVASATGLSAGDRKALHEALAAELGGIIDMTERTDPSLLAGVVVERNGIRKDASVRGRLNRLTHHLYGT